MLNLLIHTGDALSQLANTLLLAGDPNESISGRAYRCGWRRRTINAGTSVANDTYNLRTTCDYNP